jgi:hypothetical protein
LTRAIRDFLPIMLLIEDPTLSLLAFLPGRAEPPVAYG